MTHLAAISSPLPVRDREAGVTLIEVLVVLALIGVSAAVVGLAVTGGSRAAGVLEREATLLAVRFDRAAGNALERGVPAAFLWDGDGYAFMSLQDGKWSAHPDGVLGTPHRMDAGVEVLVMGQRQGQYLIRSDLLPSRTAGDDNGPAALQAEVVSATGAWHVTFDGVTARPSPALERDR